MSKKNLLYVENQVLTNLCTSCKCCLANGTHCWTCHTTQTIAELCGCGGNCVEKAVLYQEMEALRNKVLKTNRLMTTKGRAA